MRCSVLILLLVTCATARFVDELSFENTSVDGDAESEVIDQNINDIPGNIWLLIPIIVLFYKYIHLFRYLIIICVFLNNSAFVLYFFPSLPFISKGNYYYLKEI